MSLSIRSLSPIHSTPLILETKPHGRGVVAIQPFFERSKAAPRYSYDKGGKEGHFDLKEALRQWSRLKKQLHSAPFSGLPFKQFRGHVSRHYDSPLGFSGVLKLPRIALLILAGSSISERQFPAYNRMRIAERANLNITTTRSAFAINSHGPQPIGNLKARGDLRTLDGPHRLG